LVAGTPKMIPDVDETFTLPTSGGWVKLLGKILEESYRPVEAGTSRWLLT
jgi:hypothetical protein